MKGLIMVKGLHNMALEISMVIHVILVDTKGPTIEEKEEAGFSIAMVPNFNLHHTTQVLELLELQKYFSIHVLIF